MLRVGAAEGATDPYGSRLFRGFRALLEGAIHRRFFTLATAAGIVVAALAAFHS